MTALRLDLEWRTTATTAVLLPVLLMLGSWQLDRAEEKAAIAGQNAERMVAPAVALDGLAKLPAEDLAYRRVSLSGTYLSEAVIFLDNQIRDGRYGHDVLGLFIDDESGLAVLLNRGWVTGDPARRSLPEISVPGDQQRLIASVYVPPGEPYLLAGETFEDLPWPVLVQEANGHALREAIEKTTGYRLFPRELRLEDDQPTGFRRDWPVVNVSPEKHRGYALQWFTMAAALLVFFVFRSSNLLDLLRRRGLPNPSGNSFVDHNGKEK